MAQVSRSSKPSGRPSSAINGCGHRSGSSKSIAASVWLVAVTVTTRVASSGALHSIPKRTAHEAGGGGAVRTAWLDHDGEQESTTGPKASAANARRSAG